MNIKKQFPIFQANQDANSLVYLDNASTTHKPQVVVDALVNFYTHHNANVHRGVYPLAEQATGAYEAARHVVAQFINAKQHEIVFTSGTTASINMVAHAWALHTLKPGDEIVLTELEHHANLLPWQEVAQVTGATLVFIPVMPDGALDVSNLGLYIRAQTRLVAFTLVSHALGVIIPYETIINHAIAVDARILIDAAQAMSHKVVDVIRLKVDFLAFSAHKMFGPTGIGVLYINEKLHKQLKPFLTGGGMVASAEYTKAQWLGMPYLLEAGTPPIAQAVALAEAIRWLTRVVPFQVLMLAEEVLSKQLHDTLAAIQGVRIVGPRDHYTPVVAFTVDAIHPHDIAAMLGARGICVRAGHHCAHPLAKKLGLQAWVRASISVYTTPEDIQTLKAALEEIIAAW